MAGSLDSNWLRVVAYGLATVACLHVGWRERSVPRSLRRPGLWPAFWFTTAAVLLVLAVGETGQVGDLITEVGRRRARAGGWYDTRRHLQSLLVGGVGVIWFVVAIVAIWRVPERRRRCLPMALLVFTLMCFAAVRLVSLHDVDEVLYRRRIAGVRIVAVVELIVLGLAFLATYWHPFGRRDDRVAAVPLELTDTSAT